MKPILKSSADATRCSFSVAFKCGQILLTMFRKISATGSYSDKPFLDQESLVLPLDVLWALNQVMGQTLEARLHTCL
jgi:hypothetical protein